MNVRFARLATTALAATCGVLLVAALLQYAGVGRGYGWAADDPDSVPSLPGGAIDEKPLKFPPETAFAEVVEFVRVGVQILFVELAPARGEGPTPEGSLH